MRFLWQNKKNYCHRDCSSNNSKSESEEMRCTWKDIEMWASYSTFLEKRICSAYFRCAKAQKDTCFTFKKTQDWTHDWWILKVVRAYVCTYVRRTRGRVGLRACVRPCVCSLVRASVCLQCVLPLLFDCGSTCASMNFEFKSSWKHERLLKAMELVPSSLDSLMLQLM